ncbi:peptidoglycan-binding domain-containing protein [Spirulina major CS-329]|nr:peptidoglycan-binding domain-containing protein [Spirulina major]MDB9495792.1 peptidoglycan-binding domain-containing protein [Spirulina subsalsa CS-330]MDB9503778.1 peptidoglycan-binding domain-containing protein [Spirulina major CS-329]
MSLANPAINITDDRFAFREGARSQTTPLEETLTPPHSPATPSSPPNIPYYTGLILLSLLTFLFLLFLLFKKQIKEIPYSTLATVLLGVGLPILTIVQLTTDLVVREPSPPPAANPVTASPTVDVDAEAAPADESDRNPFPPLNLRIQAGREGEDLSASLAQLRAMSPQLGGAEESPVTAPNSGAGVGTAATAIAPTAPMDQTATPRPRSPQLTPPTLRSPLSSLTLDLNPSRSTPAPPPTRPPQMRSFSLSELDLTRPLTLRDILRYGSHGKDVLVIQKILTDLDLYTGPLDGYFGRLTVQAVKDFQRIHTLLPDGIVGFSTCEILDAQSPDLTLTCTKPPTPEAP